MNRSNFLQLLSMAALLKPFSSLAMLNEMNNHLKSSSKMPVLFLGHGSPMNAIEENEFVQGFKLMAASIPRPQAILCVSAHWETKGTFVTAMERPATIHDFGGFPDELYRVQYPAPGSTALVQEITEQLLAKTAHQSFDWGLDHGAWSVLRHFFPMADVPVVQLSLDYNQPAPYHYALAKRLSALRHKGVLIVGSGNMVHNLGKVSWQHINTPNYAFDWTKIAQSKMLGFIQDTNHAALINYQKQGAEFNLAIPSPEHYLPLLYVLAQQQQNEIPTFFNDKAVGGSLTMTSVLIN